MHGTCSIIANRKETTSKEILKTTAAILILLFLSISIVMPHANAASPAYSKQDALERFRSSGAESQILSSGVVGSASSSGSPSITWGQNINVFPNPFEQDEPTIAVSPANPNITVVGHHERQGPAFPAPILCAFEASSNGGGTWTRFGVTTLEGPPFVFGQAGGHSCSDAVLAADSLGNFYYSYLDLFRTPDGGVSQVDVLVAKSTDGGQSFSAPIVVSVGTVEDPDKQWIEVDRNPGSPFLGNVYVTDTDFSGIETPGVGAVIRFRESTNGGATFQPAASQVGVRVSDFGDFQVMPRRDICPNKCFDFLFRYMQGSSISIGPKGEIYVIYSDNTEVETFDFRGSTPTFLDARMVAAKIMMAKSTNGGSSWSRSVVRDMCSPAPCRSAGTDAHVANAPYFRVGSNPTASASGGLVFAAWAEYRSVTFAPVGGRDFAVSNGDIFFARTTDGGATWQPAIKVNDDTTTNDQFFPAMVARQGGVVHIVWLDRRLDSNNVKYDVFYSSSDDGGVTFSANVRVTTASSNPQPVGFIGDYIDLDGASGPFQVQAVWTDRRDTTTRNDVYTAKRLPT